MSAITIPAKIFVFNVRYRAGTYVTSTIRGQRASSTSGPEFAAAKLAHKLIPVGPVTVEQAGAETWRARESAK